MQEFSKPPNGLRAVDRAARIVRRIDDNGFRVRCDCRFECRKVNLEIVRLCGHNDEPPPARLDKDAVLGEERGNCDELIPRLGKSLERNRHGCRRTRREKQIFPRDLHAKSFFEIGGKDLAHLRFAGRNCVAVHLHRVTVCQDVHRRVPNEVGGRYARIPKAEVKDILRADLRRTLLPVFKDRADRGFLRAEFVHLL